MNNQEINYGISNDYNRNRVVGYHRSPSPRQLDKGAKHMDIAQLKSPAKRNLIEVGNGDYDARFTIGMEVEKTRLSRGAVKEYALFAGFERDSSCGYEAVTNILPLLPAGKWRNKVFNMMFEAKRIIEDASSPSDRRCGGHITLAVNGMSGDELAMAMKPFCGIVFALFRKRLTNNYCNGNIFLDRNEFGMGRYQVLNVKSNRVEFRIPSRFQSVKQMMRRYELMYTLLDFAVNKPNATQASFLKAVTPIVKSMYGRDEAKTAEIITLAKAFGKMLKTGKINREVINFVDPMRNRYVQHYDRDLTRNGYR